MKQWFSKKSNLFTLILVIFVIVRNAPQWLSSFEAEGVKIPTEDYRQLTPLLSDKTAQFPPPGKTIAIFWASWCGPCKIEMERLKSSVENGKIPVGAIYAINAFEAFKEAHQFVQENPYPFTFLYAPDLTIRLKIRATPTTLFIEDRKIQSMSSGLSIFGIWKAESFL